MENPKSAAPYNPSLETQAGNLTPVNNVTQPALPTLNPTPTKQVFIHPEHEAGSLPIANVPQVHKRLKTDHKILILSIISGALFVAGLAIAFIYLPKSQVVTFAQKTKDIVNTSSQQAEKINSSLDTLYKARTAQVEDVTVSNFSPTSPLTQTSVYKNLFEAAISLAEETKSSIETNQNVKGFAVPAYDPNKESRKHRELANDIAKKADSAKEVKKSLTQLETEEIPTGAKDLQEEVKSLNERTAKYIGEASATAEYYVALSDAAIELMNLSNSTFSVKDIDNAISKMTTIRTKFADYDKKKLPEDMESYNKDVVETFDLLINFYKDIRSGKLNSDQALANAYLQFVADVKSVSNRAASDEISFWQNNSAISSYSDLDHLHQEVTKSADNVRDENNFFLLEWMGVG